LSLLIHLYNERWNERRKTKVLGWKTTMEAVTEACIRTFAWLLMPKDQYRKDKKPLVKITDEGTFYVPIHKAKTAKQKPKNKTPRKSAVRRYLEWRDWDEKNRNSTKIFLLNVLKFFICLNLAGLDLEPFRSARTPASLFLNRF